MADALARGRRHEQRVDSAGRGAAEPQKPKAHLLQRVYVTHQRDAEHTPACHDQVDVLQGANVPVRRKISPATDVGDALVWLLGHVRSQVGKGGFHDRVLGKVV